MTLAPSGRWNTDDLLPGHSQRKPDPEEDPDVHDLAVIVLAQRIFESSEPPAVHRDIQAAAYAALD